MELEDLREGKPEAVPRAARARAGALLRASLLLLLWVSAAEAGEWRLRAREHLETGKADLGGGARAYRGFLSAFDLFYEKPFETLVGLTVHRGGLGRVGGGDSLTMTAVGLEVKRFPTRRARPWFVRGGLLAEALDPSGPGKERWVYGAAGGTGLEFPVWKLGLAPEVGFKTLRGGGGSRWDAFYAAIGVHFYVFPGDLSSR